jgi:peptide/nickel transport system permease protein
VESTKLLKNRNLGKKGVIDIKKSRGAMESTKSFLREVWSYSSGKFGVIMLIILILISIYALAVVPPEFVASWESASYWEENPQLVPPAWICQFGFSCAPNFAEIKVKPDVVNTIFNKYYYNYTFDYNLDSEVFPQDLIVKLVGVKVPIINNKPIQPTVVITLQRPDGLTVNIGNKVVQANATSGEVIKVGTSSSPLKIDIDTRTLTLSIIDYYKLKVPAEIVGTEPTYQALGEAVILGRVEEFTRRRSQEVMFGKPIVRIDVKPQSGSLNRLISDLEVVIKSVNGTTEPKQLDLKEKLINVRKILVEVNSTVLTLTDFMEKLQVVKSELSNAWKEAFVDLLLPSDQLSKLSDMVQYVDKYMTRLSQTDEFFTVDLSMQPIPGKYMITVSIIYDLSEIGGVNPGTLTSSPADQVKVIVKGTAYGLIGTDYLGRDLAELLLYGFPIALGIGVFSAFVTTVIGLLLGVISGFYGGFIDELIQRTADIIGNIPWLPILIIMAYIAQQVFAAYSPATKAMGILFTILGILILTGWGGLAITVRAMTLSIKEEPYVEAALALGASKWKIIIKHILPQVSIYAVASLISGVPGAILTEAGLSILGIRHGWPTWGAVLSSARDLGRYDVWWWILPPGVLLSLTSLTFIALGLAMEKIVEPRLRTL